MAELEVEVDEAALKAWLVANGPELLADGAEQIAQKQAELAPRDPLTGDHMADHIVVEYLEADGTAAADVGPKKKYFYAAFLVHGTEKMPPHDFISPSVDG